MNFRARSKPDPIAFQIAPMIDFLIVLLCYFVASQLFTQWEAEIDITLPTAKTAQVSQRMPGELILNIHRTGEVVVNARSLREDELRTLLQRLVGLFPGQPVLIRSDSATAYAHVIRVLDLCRQCNIWNISFATLSGEGT